MIVTPKCRECLLPVQSHITFPVKEVLKKEDQDVDELAIPDHKGQGPILGSNGRPLKEESSMSD